ncbi:MAG: segregation/condensation protein A, partial [Chloroflexi bacterium]|nr:segregation/condensation protein A [Chloroflexota bacterium]
MPEKVSIDVIPGIRDAVFDLVSSYPKSKRFCRYADVRIEVSEGKVAVAENGMDKFSTEDYGFSFGVRVLAGQNVVSPGYVGEIVGTADLPRLDSLADLADQYLAWVQMMESINIELAGEFLVMAAKLTEIKSRLLLPRPPEGEDPELEDPSKELIYQLMEYKRFKDASFVMEDMEEDAGKRFRRMADDKIEGEINPDADEIFKDLTLWDLMQAFQKIMAGI